MRTSAVLAPLAGNIGLRWPQMPEQDAELLVRDIFGCPLSCPLVSRALIATFRVKGYSYVAERYRRFPRFRMESAQGRIR